MNDETEELWDASRVGIELNPNRPLTPESARKEMMRAGIRAVRGYPASRVRAYAASRPGRGHRSDLYDTPPAEEKVCDP